MNGFQSKLALFVAGADAGVWWAVVLGIGTSLITLVVVVKAAKTIFWGKLSESASAPTVKEAPATVCIAMVVLAALCLGIGIYPRSVYKPLNAAMQSVQTVVKTATDTVARR